ncbi:MAG TPA: beta galactosidase jelly roll domain-containing protein [Chitinophagaceae bacterium]|nr:beta galactosidase jelly roll domain-containing protein [Chitinophagaceae bacterium]
MRKRIMNLAIICCLLLPNLLAAQSWHPVKGSLTTPWTGKVTPQNVHQAYPRPQMVRSQWENLNGLWNYAITPLIEKDPAMTGSAASWQGKILVPFPVESDLSGVKKAVNPDQQLWYQRTFTVPRDWKGQRVLLHFGAVDWKTTVWVNGSKVGTHQGGYDAFSFDITDALKKTGTQQLTVSVWDPSDSGFQPAGKQSLNPHGIWYTASSGIWQTVWL